MELVGLLSKGKLKTFVVFSETSKKITSIEVILF